MGLLEAMELPMTLFITLLLVIYNMNKTSNTIASETFSKRITVFPTQETLIISMGLMSLVGAFSRRRYLIAFTLAYLTFAFIQVVHYFVMLLHRVSHRIPHTCSNTDYVATNADCLFKDYIALTIFGLGIPFTAIALILAYMRMTFPSVTVSSEIRQRTAAQRRQESSCPPMLVAARKIESPSANQAVDDIVKPSMPQPMPRPVAAASVAASAAARSIAVFQARPFNSKLPVTSTATIKLGPQHNNVTLLK